MKDSEHYVGHVLDDKYRLERLLGRGGMGAVYLATHLGTERYVALKLITPQFMRNEEFVERFKREARAAGRLRHPNVVDVTDFGFADAGGEPVAYLVMEYLDGCTLGDVLKEEKRLPLEWVVDILEQVCSAVHEAHQQGIVHRDLKPDNIWLEPNRLGSYRVKVLDFGIAKLAELDTSPDDAAVSAKPPSGQLRASAAHSVPVPVRGLGATGLRTDGQSSARAMPSGDLEIDTLLYTSSGEDLALSEDDSEINDTQLFASSTESKPASSIALPAAVSHKPHAPPFEAFGDNDHTLKFDPATRPVASGARTTLPAAATHGTELTRVGAIMGTPLYMSPEQCRGKNLDSRSDTYSLGVIAYQMLAGEPPFAGDTSTVMKEHVESAPRPLRERNKKVPKRLAQLVMSTLAKDPADRPQTAAAFASSLRAQAQSIGSLYRRAFALYSEYFPKFLKISLIAHIPLIITTILLVVLQLAAKSQPAGWGATKVAIIVVLVIVALLHVCAQFLAAATISGMTAVIVTRLSAAPLSPVELRTPLAFLKRRWKPFIKTTIRVTLRILIGYVLLIIPGLVMTVRYSLYAPVVLLEGLEKKAALRRARELGSRSWRTVIIVTVLQIAIPMVVGGLIGRSVSVRVTTDGSPAAETNKIYQQLTGLVNIFIVPLLSIVPALLYLKMRQLGGESISPLLAQIDEADDRSREWQQRMRSRLSLPTPRSQTPIT